MIKNDRQFHIISARAVRLARLQQDLQVRLAESPDDQSLGFELRAVTGELSRMRNELDDFEALKAGRVPVGDAGTIEDIPRLLIRARIASGLSQAALAERLGMKPQLLQRYEATDYEGVSLARLIEIGKALELRLGAEAESEESVSVASLLARLGAVGIDRELVIKRIAPQLQGRRDPASLITAAARLGRVFRWDLADLFSDRWHPTIEEMPTMAYKLPASASERRVKAYSAYVRFLGEVVLAATPDFGPLTAPVSPSDVRDALLKIGGITFENALRYVWNLGIPIVPLCDPGSFHAAYLRQEGRRVIILKQLRKFEALWLFDLLHELWHAVAVLEEPTLEAVEAPFDDRTPVERDQETAANDFARHVLFGDGAERLVRLVREKAAGRQGLLKRTVMLVARKEKVDVGLLAYLIAHEERVEGRSWWAAATALQRADGDPWAKARDLLLEHVKVGVLSPLDHDLLVNALRDPDDQPDPNQIFAGTRSEQ